MKLLVGFALAILVFVACAERPSFTLEPMDWSATISVNGMLVFTASKDLLIYPDVSALVSGPTVKRAGIQGSPVLVIRRRNAEGAYLPVANLTASIFYYTTNGKWILTYGNGQELYHIDENNQVSNSSVIDANLSGSFLLSDDTVVGFDNTSPLDDGNYTIRTYQYEASNNTWQEIPEAGLVVTTQAVSQGIFNTYFVTDSHLVLADVTNTSNIVVNIYERQADKSWSWKDTVSVNSTVFSTYISIKYNNVDTLVVSNYAIPEDNAAGVVFVYTKINGKWTEQKFTTANIDFNPIGYFGYAAVFLDANNLVVAAPFESFTDLGSGFPSVAGKVLLITRNADGLWEPSVDLLGPRIWGLGVAVTDREIIIPSLSLLKDINGVGDMLLYTVPRCFTQPINVTCNNQQVNDCSQVNITSLYTVNNPQCGAVSATINGISLVDNKALEAQFSFTKGFGADYSCNATVSCPVPPIVVQQTPSKVSSSVGVQFGLVSIFGVVAILFM